MIDKSTRYSILLEYYEKLLTPRQQSVTKLYYDENFSLAEIAEEFAISRQAVHDALKKTETALDEYEEKLHMAHRLFAREAIIKEVDGQLELLQEQYGENKELTAKLQRLREVIDTLEEIDALEE